MKLPHGACEILRDHVVLEREHEGQALRSETTINDTRDSGVGLLLKNLPALRRIGQALLNTVLMFVLVAPGFTNKDLRQAFGVLLGRRAALFYTRVCSRILRPAMALVVPAAPAHSSAALHTFHAAEAAVNSWCNGAHIAA